MSDNKLTLRSYRLAFEVERRLHRIDRFRIPVPYGIPLAGLAYGTGVTVGMLVVAQLPLVGSLLHVLPWPLRLILLPGLITRALCRTKADGRPAHEALVAYMVFLVAPRRLVGLAPAPATDTDLGVVTIAPDERSANYRSGMVRGPGAVFVRGPGRLEVRGRLARLRPIDGDALSLPQEIALANSMRLEITECARR
jgi:hypothetical protein